jgi:hypothetical protein
VKDGDFDRLRIPMDSGSGAAGAIPPDPDDADDAAADPDERQVGVAASPAQLAAGSAILAGLIVAGIAAFRRRGRGTHGTNDGHG